MGRRRLGVAVTVMVTVPMVLTVSGCSSLGPDESAAGDAARTFSMAASNGDGDAACSLLAEGTREELEESSGSPCESAVVEEDLPSAGQVVDVSAFGTNAQVELDGDVVFLSGFGGSWKVVAAGCRPRPSQPYDCSLRGG